MPERKKNRIEQIEQRENLVQNETSLKYQLETERFIAALSMQFVNLKLDKLDHSLNLVVRSLGRFIGADRCYIILFRDTVTIDKVYEWCGAGVEAHLDHLQGISIDSIPWFGQMVEEARIKKISRAVDISAAMKDGHELWSIDEVQSIIQTPIFCFGNLVGILGLESIWLPRNWQQVETTLLERVCKLVAAILEFSRQEGERQANEELFQEIVSSITDHVYVTEVTEAGERKNLHLSHHAQDLTDYSTEQLLADWSLWPETIIHPDDRLAAAAQADRLARGEDSETEYRLVRADGTVIWVRDRARVKTKGTSKIVYGLVSDITKRKMAELEREWLTNELRDIKETLEERVWGRTAELQAIIDAVGEGIVVTDLNGIIQYVNPALEHLTGYSEAEALGQTPSLWKSNHHNHSFFTQMWHTILSGQTWRGEVVNKHKDGHLYEAVLTISPIPGPDSQALGFVGVQHDITPFKEMDRMKSEFISTAAHELRTPLTSIRGFSEILNTRQLPEERKTRYLNYINQQAEALAAIIDDLLDLSRLEAGEGFVITDDLVDVKTVVEEIIFGFQENHSDHQYHLFGPGSWPLMRGDPAKLSQLFKNMFSNATKYSPDGGEITFTAEVKSAYQLVHFTLTDQGIGMKPEQVAKIFDRFYRVDASNTAPEGTGLGMTISRLIVELHGGKIWVESEYGSGTTVQILLPLPDRPTHILVVEDDEVLQEIQQRHLELQGFQVFTAGEGESGLQLAQACLPNLILLDLALPGMTGFTVLDKLHTNELTRGIPIIITSAMDRPEEVEKTLSNVVIDYLVKPYTMNDLTVRVNRGLAKTRHEIGRKWYSYG